MMFKRFLVVTFLQLSTVSLAQSGDPTLTIRQTEAPGQVVRVSFDGDKLPFGLLTITDSEGKIAYRMEQAELIPSPNYFTLNLGELPKGVYTLTIETKLRKYDQPFKIQ